MEPSTSDYKCPHCGRPPRRENAKFCAECAQLLYNSCSNCGEDLFVDERHCEICGAPSEFFKLRLGRFRDEQVDDDPIPF